MSVFMEDCIHLKACRRLQKIGKSYGFTFPRGCKEKCTAYCSEKNVVDALQDIMDYSFNAGIDNCDYVRVDAHKFIDTIRGEA